MTIRKTWLKTSIKNRLGDKLTIIYLFTMKIILIRSIVSRQHKEVVIMLQKILYKHQIY